ncbi:MAG: hypothetical protein M3R54_13500 [Chloroflexota bacterium]|nr:hypothetical protein [Chloroflexota bacterium]
MAEVVVGRYEDEIEAEAAAGHLRSLELAARVTYRATAGVPRPLSPIRVVAPFGTYEVVVPEAQVPDAGAALAEIGAPAARPARYRWLGAVLVIVWLLPLVVGALGALRVLFRGY